MYDSLASPITLEGEIRYREVCETRILWDQKLPRELAISWQTWETNRSGKIEVPRSIVHHQETTTCISIHAFGEARSQGVSTAVYAVTHQSSGVSQGLVTAKSRLAKKGLKISRIELVAGHMAANLVSNVRDALEEFPLEVVYCWLNSSVALHWIKGVGNYKQFISNRVRKIQEKEYIQWRDVGTKETPRRFRKQWRGNQQGFGWWHGSSWPPYQDRWPENTATTPTEETQAEAKIVKELLGVTAITDDQLDLMIRKRDL